MNTKLLSLVLVTSLAAVGACSKSEPDKSKPTEDGASETSDEGSQARSKSRKSGGKSREDKADKDDEVESGGDPSDGIGACDEWKKKLSSCEVLKKTAPSLIEKTAVVWRKKGLSKDDIEKDCKERAENLPKPCR
ncbi:MAG: hypothetical protein JNL21_26565 [Myxococcales bacterium]|nr:hypothetical protein [Myxococcales bacterium]